MNRTLAYWQSKIGFEFVIGKKLIGNLRDVTQIKTLLGAGFMLTFRIEKSVDDQIEKNCYYDFEIFNNSEDILIEEKTDRHELIDTRILDVEFEQQ